MGRTVKESGDIQPTGGSNQRRSLTSQCDTALLLFFPCLCLRVANLQSSAICQTPYCDCAVFSLHTAKEKTSGCMCTPITALPLKNTNAAGLKISLLTHTHTHTQIGHSSHLSPALCPDRASRQLILAFRQRLALGLVHTRAISAQIHSIIKIT